MSTDWYDELFNDGGTEPTLHPSARDKIRHEPNSKKQICIINAWWQSGSGRRSDYGAIANRANQKLSDYENPITEKYAKNVIKRFIGHDDSFDDLTQPVQLAIDMWAKHGTEHSANRVANIHENLPSRTTFQRSLETYPEIIKSRQSEVAGVDLLDKYGVEDTTRAEAADAGDGGVSSTRDFEYGLSFDFEEYHLAENSDGGSSICSKRYGTDPRISAPVEEIEQNLDLELCDDCRKRAAGGPWAAATMFEMRQRLDEEDWFDMQMSQSNNYLAHTELAQIMDHILGWPDGAGLAVDD